MKISSAALLASAVASCAITGVWSFVQPAAVVDPSRRETSPAAARRRGGAAAPPPPSGGGSRAASSRLSSSPFEGTEHDSGGEDEVDVVQREAEQLEEMIRGSRGVVVEAIEREWREEMLRVLGEEGEKLCSEAYGGYLDRGRGAIFVNVDMGLSSSNKGHGSAPCHAVFRTLEEVVMERSSRVKPADQMQIVQRTQEYDPEASFVVVFGHKGMLGVQVMRPSIAPREVYQTRGGAP